MTPKEKAIELVSKMYNVEDGGTGIVEKSNSYFPNGDVHWYDSKKYALIAVDEILTSLRDKDLYCAGENNINDCIKHWQEVKAEIEAL
ncbi:MAG: hypothetical protein ACK5A2_09265 [Bacteroidota bacterium]|jgi:hypothetical protein